MCSPEERGWSVPVPYGGAGLQPVNRLIAEETRLWESLPFTRSVEHAGALRFEASVNEPATEMYQQYLRLAT